MPAIRLLFLWHMHQPYYKDLVTGEYRLPWVRLHALKDYFGMVRLLEEFPNVHQTFNLVPGLMVQIQDYVRGKASDAFLEVASEPAASLSQGQKEFALTYLFQANQQNMIARYPRYQELWDKLESFSGKTEKAAALFSDQDFTDLQVLSQVVWFDEFWLEDPPPHHAQNQNPRALGTPDPDIRDLIIKGRGYTRQDQQLVIAKQKELLAQVLPAYAAAQKRGSIEISTSPFYHPILPLICDTDAGAASHAGLPLPRQRFRQPEDAREQIVRGLKLHEEVFGVRPRGMWPSEGSVSNDVLAIACNAGIQWMATDEGVLGRSLGTLMQRNGAGMLDNGSAERLYRIYRWEQGDAAMNLVFRDHSLSDLIGFVYSGVPAKAAAEDFILRIKACAAPLLQQGMDAVVPIILDGENAWEYYPKSGREFLRRIYDAIQADETFEALTISEALERTPEREKLNSVVPGSWINANFDVWIGAPEDNLAWEHLAAARDFFSENAEAATPEQQQLAFEELLIAEGSDWNWWYGPEHHSANDRDFDELYRKHLSNVYHALGAEAPEVLAHPITGAYSKAQFTPQSAYISPRLESASPGYFDWLGAATHVADRRAAAMHGKVFLLDTGYAGIDEHNLYCRLDFMEKLSEWPVSNPRLLVNIEVTGAGGKKNFKLEATCSASSISEWNFSENGHPPQKPEGIAAVLRRDSVVECKIPLAALNASVGNLVRVRFSLWQGQLPIDALPQEGAIEIQIVPEEDLSAVAYAKP